MDVFQVLGKKCFFSEGPGTVLFLLAPFKWDFFKFFVHQMQEQQMSP